MFRGLHDDVAEPFRRRLAPPLLARVFGPDPIDSFLILNVIAMVVVAVTTTTILVLSYRDARHNAYRWVSALGFAGVVAFSRNTFHHFVNAPVLTDYLAVAGVFLAVFAIFTSSRGNKSVGVASILVAVPLAILSREVFGPAFIAAAIAMLITRHLRGLGLYTAISSTALTTFTLLTSNADDSLGVISGWIVAYTTSWQSVTIFGVMLGVSLGVWPIIVLIDARSAVKQEWLRPILVLALSLFTLSVFGGGNLDRILLPVGLLLTFVAAVRIRNNYQLAAFAAAAYGMIIMQYPFYIMPEGAHNFLGFIDFWHSSTFEEVLSFGVGGILMASPLLVSAVVLAWLARSRAETMSQSAEASDRNSA